MTNLKLPKLPDRTLVKIAFRASPELAQMLSDYAATYRAAYAQPDATVEELIPFILATFIESDKKFKLLRKQPRSNDTILAPESAARGQPKQRDAPHSAHSSTSKSE